MLLKHLCLDSHISLWGSYHLPAGVGGGVRWSVCAGPLSGAQENLLSNISLAVFPLPSWKEDLKSPEKALLLKFPPLEHLTYAQGLFCVCVCVQGLLSLIRTLNF